MNNRPNKVIMDGQEYFVVDPETSSTTPSPVKIHVDRKSTASTLGFHDNEPGPVKLNRAQRRFLMKMAKRKAKRL